MEGNIPPHITSQESNLSPSLLINSFNGPNITYINSNEEVVSGTAFHINYHSDSIIPWKMSISHFHFIPSNNVPWKETTQTGYPTHSPHFSCITRHMKLFEIQCHGVSSQAWRAMTMVKFERYQEFLWWHKNRWLCLVGAAASTFHLSMIGRVDDCFIWQEVEINVYPQFPEDDITGHIPWSKNVHKERDSLLQVLLDSIPSPTLASGLNMMSCFTQKRFFSPLYLWPWPNPHQGEDEQTMVLAN